MTSTFALDTERLILCGWRDADHGPMLAICTDPLVMQHLGPPMTGDEVNAAMARHRGFQHNLGYCFWIMERRDTGETIGFCGLKPGPVGTPIEGCIEIGWRMAASAWGKGYAREAAQASLAWGWTNLPDSSIWAITVLGNLRSWGLMERIGMKRHDDLDFEHPDVAPDSPMRHCITYSIARPQ